MKNLLQPLILLLLVFFSSQLHAQDIDFTVRFNPSAGTYEVYATPDFTNPDYFVGGGSQISLVLPISIADAGLVITTANGGFWSDNSQVYSPAADPAHDFHSIASNGSSINFVAGQEILLYTFAFPGGGCIGDIRLFENATDPNSAAAGMGGGDFLNYFANAFTFADAYNANYANAGTSCNPPVVIPNPLTIPQDSIGTICLVITDPDIEDTFTASSCGVSNGTETVSVIGSEVCIVYVPDSGFNGTDSICIIVCDQTNLCDTTIIPVTVVPPLPPVDTFAPPVVITTPLTILEDSTGTVCTPILDPNIGDTFTATLCTGSPQNGTANPSIIGSILCVEYTPNLGYTGNDEICVIVCDQTNLCDTVNIPVTILPTLAPPDSIQPPVIIMPPVVGTADTTITVCGPIIDPNGNDTHTVTICQQPSNGTATAIVNNTTGQLCVAINPNENFVGDDSLCVIVCDQTGLCDTANIPITILPSITKLEIKVMLQGAMLFTNDGLMRDDLRTMGLIPLNQPYNAELNSRFVHIGGGNETTNPIILSQNAFTQDAVVDWVFIEIRDPANSSSIIKTISALVQRDGDVIDAGTGKTLSISSLPTSFYVSVKHRNHLGTMTATPLSRVGGTVKVDFTTMGNADLFHLTSDVYNYDGVEMTTISGKRALWAGNANVDKKIKYDGSANGRIKLINEVLTFQGNSTSLNLNYDKAIGYYQGDIDMNGKAKYDGGLNDRIIIQNIVLTYPLNSLTLNNFNDLKEQLP